MEQPVLKFFQEVQQRFKLPDFFAIGLKYLPPVVIEFDLVRVSLPLSIFVYNIQILISAKPDVNNFPIFINKNYCNH